MHKRKGKDKDHKNIRHAKIVRIGHIANEQVLAMKETACSKILLHSLHILLQHRVDLLLNVCFCLLCVFTGF